MDVAKIRRTVSASSVCSRGRSPTNGIQCYLGKDYVRLEKKRMLTTGVHSILHNRVLQRFGRPNRPRDCGRLHRHYNWPIRLWDLSTRDPKRVVYLRFD
jgi:hypothetical protein